MATVISHNILSPLGFTSEMNYHAMKCGKSSLHRYEQVFDSPLKVTASIFDDETRKELLIDGFTLFESIVIRSIQKAIEKIDISLADSCLILSTTKADIESLGVLPDESILPGHTAQRIAQYLGFINAPIVVCNACISGVSALITAARLIDLGIYTNVVICGCDILGKFIVSGFDSLKALSPDECKPFDEERIGLNLGEAAATIVLSKDIGKWHICRGEICNDAYHITTPSPKGIGLGTALQRILKNGKEDLAFINLHGTATMYNDQMEWKALEQSHLTDVPANALKGYVGHTMGAAGILECIISMLSVDDGIILGTRGYNASGVSGNINISSSNRFSDKSSFIKLISGFGGCNAAIYFTSKADKQNCTLRPNKSIVISNVQISNEKALVNTKQLVTSEKGKNLLFELYKNYIGDYPRFYKMDGLSRLGLLATELLIKAQPIFDWREQTAVVLFNQSSSICADKKYLKSIHETENYFPSPGAFVYTLPNIVNGEIALRHNMHGETSFYILPDKNEEVMKQLVEATLANTNISYCITGWLEYTDDNHFVADIKLIKNNLNKKDEMEELTLKLKEQIIEALNLEGMSPEDIDVKAPLFGDAGIGLDSIDALEIIVLLEKNYGIRLQNAAEGKAIFTSIENIAKYVNEHRTK